MRPVDVLCHLPHPHPFLQVEVHAASVGDQPDGRVDAYRPHPLLHACGLEVEDASDLQDLQLAHHQPVHRLLQVEQACGGALQEAQLKEIPELVPTFQDPRGGEDQHLREV